MRVTAHPVQVKMLLLRQVKRPVGGSRKNKGGKEVTCVNLGDQVRGETRKDSGARPWEPHKSSALSVASPKNMKCVLSVKGNIAHF